MLLYFLERVFEGMEWDWVNTKISPIPKPIWGENMR
jgi:hypothetical protein